MYGEVNLRIAVDAASVNRVRFCQRPDRLFTYYVEHLSCGPASEGSGWRLVRDGGLFADEAEMERDARAAPTGPAPLPLHSSPGRAKCSATSLLSCESGCPDRPPLF